MRAVSSASETGLLRKTCVPPLSLLTGLLAVSLSLPAQSPSVLHASRVFDVNLIKPNEVTAKLTVHAFRTARTGLYFLVSTSSSNLLGISSVLHTDHHGIYRGTMRLPATAEVLDFDVQDTGTVSVLAVDRTLSSSGAVLLNYNPDGTPAQIRSLAAPASALVMAHGTPVIFTRGTTGPEMLRLDDNSKGMAIPLRRSTAPVLMIGLPDRRVLLAERRSAVLYVVDLDRRSVADYAPRIPEMGWLASLSPGDAIRNIAFSSVAVTPAGRVVALLGHYRLSEGAPLLSFDVHGDRSETIRCMLPQFADEKSENNSGGEMIAAFVGGSSASGLTLVSASGKVAVYGF